MTQNPVCVTDLNTVQLQELIARMGEPAYRARQLQHWVYQRLAGSFDEMSDLPADFRQKLVQETRLHSITLAHEVTGGDGTVKALFTLADGKTVESTFMPYPPLSGRARQTLCISTQVGCPVGCPFCATGQQGFERNLTPGEIIDQVLYFARRMKDRGNGAKNKRDNSITNVVFMGMGEPLANYDALLQAIEMLNSPDGLGLGARRMTISTSGLVPGIERLSREKLQVGLAVSLHASDNALRNKLVPINKKYPLEALIAACRAYCKATETRISFEYILFEGLNDSIEQARSVARLLAGLDCHVNLIPANRSADRHFKSPSPEAVAAFQAELQRQSIFCTVREKRGLDIDGGCGQLRSRLMNEAHREPRSVRP
ncbi:MAG: 23S rRNA (adenine(2503)-C(2))-methyltransferase RlmN [Chloroflexi bacterium]|nr:23S rRNA (adenine(2503)-C(2))-methyltransferase RlmN [Chloroflexota bacterium]